MPPIRRKMAIVPGQPEKDVVSVEVAESQEGWNRYVLDDGVTMKTKFIISEVWKVEGETDPAGNPIYAVKGMLVTDFVSASLSPAPTTTQGQTP